MDFKLSVNSFSTAILSQSSEGNKVANKEAPTAKAFQEKSGDAKNVKATGEEAIKNSKFEITKSAEPKQGNPGEATQMQNKSNSEITVNKSSQEQFDKTALAKDAGGRAGGVNTLAQSDDQHKNGKSPGQDPASIAQNTRTFLPYASDRQVSRKKDNQRDGGNGRNRRFAKLPNQKAPSIIHGATVAESSTQDMFIPSGLDSVSTAMKTTHNRSVIEQLKEYQMGPVATSLFHNVCANADLNIANSIGPNMQKSLFGELARHLTEVDDVHSKEYRLLIREIVQGVMKAAKKYDVGSKEITKMLVTAVLHLSPHNDDPGDMEEVMKQLAAEVIYGKINLGYQMKTASYNLGAALYTLSLYLKNYQAEVEYSKDLEDRLKDAVGDALWYATGEITNFSQSQAQANVNQLMAGFVQENEDGKTNLVKNTLLSPLKKVEGNQFVKGILERFGK